MYICTYYTYAQTHTAQHMNMRSLPQPGKLDVVGELKSFD